MTRKAYKSDLTNEEWRIIEPLIPPAKPGGHPRTVDIREIVNAIFYLLLSWLFLGDAHLLTYRLTQQFIITFVVGKSEEFGSK